MKTPHDAYLHLPQKTAWSVCAHEFVCIFPYRDWEKLYWCHSTMSAPFEWILGAYWILHAQKQAMLCTFSCAMVHGPTSHVPPFRFHGFLSGVFGLAFGNWVPWYKILVVIVVLPLLLVEVERLTHSSTDQVLPHDPALVHVLQIQLTSLQRCLLCGRVPTNTNTRPQNALRGISMAMVYVSNAVVMYIAWYSCFRQFSVQPMNSCAQWPYDPDSHPNAKLTFWPIHRFQKLGIRG